MSKSLFEKLFEEVMQGETDSAQFGDGDAGNMGGDLEAMGGKDGGEEVTLTLDRETAQKLMDLLSAQLAGGGEVGGGEVGGGEAEGSEMSDGEEDNEWGSEDSEDEDEGEEDKYGKKEGNDEDSEEVRLEAPQAQYKPFNNKGESLQSKNNKVSGALAANATGGGKAPQTSQTPGTEKYMPAKTTYDDGKSMKVSGARASSPSGPSKSVFHP